MGFRVTLLIFIFAFLYSALTLNIYNLQLEEGDYYKAKAESIYRSSGIFKPKRGNIYFTDKNENTIPASLNREYPTVYAIPEDVEDPFKAAKFIAETLELSEEDLITSLSKKNDPYEPIAPKVADSIALAIKEFGEKGIHVGYEPFRFYPLGSIASHVLGFVSTDVDNKIGLYGIESYYEELLNGSSGSIEEDIFVSPRDGKDLNLAIDRNIQTQSESILKELISDYSAKSGSVIVQNPKTGEILAMANFPNFDPNKYNEYSVKNFLNPSVQAIYEPGSIFKVITMAIGLDAGKFTPETKYLDSGSITYNGRTIRNWDLKAHGQVTMTNVLEKSLNTGAANAERLIGHDLFYDYLVKFGLKEQTGIDLPGEVAGSLKPLEESKRDINFATASFGQGISVTPIRLINAISAIANGGVMMRPYLNKELKPEIEDRVISASASKEITDMMISAVDKAEVAKINGYTVAGKTGTAQVPDFARGGYKDEVINTYVGFAPAHNPKFTILIKLDEPSGAPLAGLTVVPAFREIAQFILNYYSVPPDRTDKAIR
ncbi:MAG TPA: penicillin-binding protein 2 [Candidatus Paceibacterota bacterium]